MKVIGLQQRTEAQAGVFSSYWFENPTIGLARSKFYRLEIPLSPFDSGLDYDEQPVETIMESAHEQRPIYTHHKRHRIRS